MPERFVHRYLTATRIDLEDSSYADTKTCVRSLQEAELIPTCIVTPSTAQDVSTIVSTITGDDGCPFAVKGGGHDPAAGSANIQSGITIDMTNLASVTVNSDKTVASIGAGASWLGVYVYLDGLGVAVAGGRNAAVGVGGLTLGCESLSFKATTPLDIEWYLD